MTADPNSYWSNYIPMAEMLLRFTRHQAHGLAPFMVITGRHPMLPTMLISDHGWGDMEDASEKQQEKYADWLAEQAFLINTFVDNSIRHYEQC